MAEELTLKKLGGKGGAVNGDERLLRTIAQGMDCLGGHLFAGAALSLDQDGRLAWGNLTDGLEDPLHRGRTPDHLVWGTGLHDLAS